MLAAMLLDELIKNLPEITVKDLTQLYRTAYKEGYKEGGKDAKETCGCQDED